MQIIQKSIRTVAQEELQGAVIMYSYESENDNNPVAVAFSVNRQQQDSYPPIQGTVTTHDFNVQNSNFQVEDIELYKHIHEVCSEIINGKTNQEKQKTKQ